MSQNTDLSIYPPYHLWEGFWYSIYEEKYELKEILENSELAKTSYKEIKNWWLGKRPNTSISKQSLDYSNSSLLDNLQNNDVTNWIQVLIISCKYGRLELVVWLNENYFSFGKSLYQKCCEEGASYVL